MSAARPVEAVVFDWGGTLTPWHTIDPHQQWLAYADAYDPDDAARAHVLAGRLRAAEDDAWVLSRDEHRATHLDAIFAAAGIAPVGERHARALRSFEQGWDPHTLADPDAVPLLTALRARGLRIGVLSNTLWSRDHHERVFARDGLLGLVDAAVYTSEISWTKPHPEAFLAITRSLGVEAPERVVFVGDRVFDDIHGAREVGMRTILVPHSDIPASQAGPVDGEPDAVVDRLIDVLGLVDGWLVDAD